MKRKKSKIRLLANLVTIGGALLVTEIGFFSKRKSDSGLDLRRDRLNYADGHLEET